MTRYYWSTILPSIALLFFVLSWPISTFAQPAITAPVATPAQQAPSPTSTTEELDFLKEQTVAFQSAIQSERTAYIDFIEFTLNKLQWLIGAAAAIFLFVGGATIWQIKEKAEPVIQGFVNSYLQGVTKKKIDPLVKKVEEELTHRTRKTVFLVPEGEQRVVEAERLLLERRFTVSVETDVAASKKADLIIYLYSPGSQTATDQQLYTLIEQLKKNGGNKPVIIYTYGRCPDSGDRLTVADQEYLKKNYSHYYVLANFPATLVNSVFTTLNAYI